MPGRSAARTAVWAALLLAATSACGTAGQASTTSATGAPSAGVPTAPATLRCPEARNGGTWDYFGDTPGEPWDTVIARFTRQSLREQHPDAEPTITAETSEQMVVTFIGDDGQAVARLQLERMSAGWRPVYDEVCSTMPPEHSARHY